MAASLADANLQPVCQNCSTSTTPLWRRDENGSVLCNACGLFLKLHGRPRPISLKTNVIKSRNRVKVQQGQGPRGRKSNGSETQTTNSLAASHPDVAALPPNETYNPLRRSSHKFASSRSNSPISQTDTPSNIAPQHVFDGAFSHHNFDSPSLPSFSLRQPSPSAASINGLGLERLDGHGGVNGHNGFGPSSLDSEALKTRVSELEVINDLFRGRVDELERSEQDARRNEQEARIQSAAAQESEVGLRKQLQEVLLREETLKRKVAELEKATASQASPERRSKRAKVGNEE